MSSVNVPKFVLKVIRDKMLNLVQEMYRFSLCRIEDCLHVEGARLSSLFYAKTIAAWQNII